MTMPSRVLALVASLASVSPAFASGQTTVRMSGEGAGLNDAFASIDRTFEEYRLDAHVPGLVYGIVASGRLVHLRTLGVQDLETRRPVTSDTLFRIASMTKAFTALSILKLRDEGSLTLDAPAETWLPELRGWKYPTEDSPRIRVRDLLNHTAGFVTDDPWGDRQTPLPEADFTRMLQAGVPFTRPPATAYEYSNLGYAMLGRIVATVSRQPYKDYVESTLLRPLGMVASGFEAEQAPRELRALGYRWEDDEWREEPTLAHGAFSAMGGLQTSATEYARYVAWLLSAWPARDGADAGPVRRSSVRELAQGSNFPRLRPRFGRSGADACRQASAYGMGMIVATDCDLGLTLSHSGGYPGYGSHVLLLPEHGIGVFAFANRTYAFPAPPTWDAAVALHRAGLARGSRHAAERSARSGLPRSRLGLRDRRRGRARQPAGDELPARPLGRELGPRARPAQAARRPVRHGGSDHPDGSPGRGVHLGVRARPTQGLPAAGTDQPADDPGLPHRPSRSLSARGPSQQSAQTSSLFGSGGQNLRTPALLPAVIGLLSLCAAPAGAATLREAIASDYAYLEALFKHLHANPELSMQEANTSDRLARELETLGFTLTRNIGKTGLVGTLRNGEGPVLLIRADMDALPVQEKTGLDYASTVLQVNLEGIDMPVMHACGHDMHVTSLVGVARRMVALKPSWRGTLLLVGQPAEEALGGARAMVADGLYRRVGRPDYALALHVIAKYPAGKIAFSDGLMYSSADTVRIDVRGVATHGASPHLGTDPVVIGSQIVLALQNIVTREISPIEPALITVGAFRAARPRT